MSSHLSLVGQRVSAGVCRVVLSDRYVVTVSATDPATHAADYAFLHYSSSDAYEVALALLAAGYQAMRSADLSVAQWDDVLDALGDAWSAAAGNRTQRQRDDEQAAADEDDAYLGEVTA